MKKIISLIIFLVIITMASTVYAYVHVAPHVAHISHSSSTHSSSSAKTSTSSSKSTISGAKTYTTPKNFTGKYNSNNIKTQKVQEASNYNNYSTTNMFRPNFWTAMWLFACMNNNSVAVSEQDIAKELEERGYTQEEIQDILKEGEEAKQAQEEQDKQDATMTWWVLGALVVVLIIAIVLDSIF